MKKKIFGSIAVLAIAAMAAFNMGLDSKTSGMSDVMLANVEALAQSEYQWYENRSDYYDSQNKCYHQCVMNGTGCVYMYNYLYNC